MNQRSCWSESYPPRTTALGGGSWQSIIHFMVLASRTPLPRRYLLWFWSLAVAEPVLRTRPVLRFFFQIVTPACERHSTRSSLIGTAGQVRYCRTRLSTVLTWANSRLQAEAHWPMSATISRRPFDHRLLEFSAISRLLLLALRMARRYRRDRSAWFKSPTSILRSPDKSARVNTIPVIRSMTIPQLSSARS